MFRGCWCKSMLEKVAEYVLQLTLSFKKHILENYSKKGLVYCIKETMHTSNLTFLFHKHFFILTFPVCSFTFHFFLWKITITYDGLAICSRILSRGSGLVSSRSLEQNLHNVSQPDVSWGVSRMLQILFFEILAKKDVKSFGFILFSVLDVSLITCYFRWPIFQSWHWHLVAPTTSNKSDSKIKQCQISQPYLWLIIQYKVGLQLEMIWMWF